ncbi:hypothetical protein ACFXAZ_08045 [Streptomyces sp. NPDC059477]|uniref:hypothetical protein n=1 Tax=Streptomyces sp. NPDC059477 TaxID=3346847 RepID=UPI00369B7C9A
MVGLPGALTQFALRSLTLLAAALLTALAFLRPEAALLKATLTITVVLIPYALRRAWRALMTHNGGSRCFLHPDGLTLTTIFGGVRSTVTWRNALTLKRMTHVSLLMAVHRVEITHQGRRPLTFIALGTEPELITRLEAAAAQQGLRH